MNSELLSYYPYFEANQVLTSTHLNELRQYLDEQIRLSRAQLSGVGIACGLTFRIWEPNAIELESLFTDADVKATAKVVLSVLEGFGITSEGFFLGMRSDRSSYDSFACDEPESHFVKYRPYQDPSSDQYWWNDILDSAPEQEAEILLLLTENAAASEIIQGVVETSEEHFYLPKEYNFYKDKVLVLYLEQSDVSLKTCIGNDCDNKGQKRYIEPRLLLMDKGEAGKVKGKNFGFDINPVVANLEGKLVKVEDPEPLALPRLIEGMGGLTMPEVLDIDPIISGYESATDAYNISIVDHISDALSVYGPFLGLSQFEEISTTDLPNYKNADLDIQVYYAFLRDLTKAYNEFIELAYYLVRDCCNADYKFCRHLMLGLVHPTDQNAQAIEPYRNYFFNTAITPEQSRNFYRVQLMYRRLIEMVRGFEPKTYSDEMEDVMVVPSREFDAPMGKSAVADFLDKGDNIDNLVPFWNPDLSLRGRAKWVYSFVPARISALDAVALQIPALSASAPNQVMDPLRYNFDWADFFRIQNLLHFETESVREMIEKKLIVDNLPFKVVTLTLGKKFILEQDEADTLFGSLNTDYQSARVAALQAAGKFEELVANLDFADLTAGMDLGGFDGQVEANEATTGIRKSLTPDTLMDFAFTEAVDGSGLGMRWGEWFWEKWLQMQNAATHIMALVYHQRDRLVHRAHPDSDEVWLEDHLVQLNDYLSLLEVIITNPAGDQMTALYFQLFSMVQAFADTNPRLFHNFAKDHPGMEHMNGVPKGGTLILVESFDYSGSTSAIPGSFPIGVDDSGSQIQFFDPEAVTISREIVADFCLPYACCNDFSNIQATNKDVVKLPPFAGTDVVTVDHATIIDIPVLLDDFDPGTGTIMDKAHIRIQDVHIFTEQGNPGSASAYPATGPEQARYKYIKYSSPNDKPLVPTLVGISYTVHNSETNLSTQSVLWVMVREDWKKPIIARPDITQGNLCDRIIIDVLQNDLHEYRSGNLNASVMETASLTLSSGLLSGTSSDLGAQLQVLKVGGTNVVAYYPIKHGADKFTYTIEFASGETSSSTVYLEITECCCCEDQTWELEAWEQGSMNLGFDQFAGKGKVEAWLLDEKGNEVDSIGSDFYKLTINPDSFDMTFESSEDYFGEIVVPFVIYSYGRRMECRANLIITVNPPKEIIAFTKEAIKVNVSFDLLSNSEMDAGYNTNYIVAGALVPDEKLENSGQGTWTRDRNKLEFAPEEKFIGTAVILIGKLDKDGRPKGLINVRVIVACDCEGVVPEVVTVTTNKQEFCSDETAIAVGNLLVLSPAPDGSESLEAVDANEVVVQGGIVFSGGSYYFLPGQRTNSGTIASPVTISYTIHGVTGTHDVVVNETPTSTFKAKADDPFMDANNINVAVLPYIFDNTASQNGSHYEFNYGDGSLPVISSLPLSTTHEYRVFRMILNKVNTMFREDSQVTASQLASAAGGCASTTNVAIDLVGPLGYATLSSPEFLGTALQERYARSTVSQTPEYADVVQYFVGLNASYDTRTTITGWRNGVYTKGFISAATTVVETLFGAFGGFERSPENELGYLYMLGAVVHSLIRVADYAQDIDMDGPLAKLLLDIANRIPQLPIMQDRKTAENFYDFVDLAGTLKFADKPNLAEIVGILKNER